MKNFFQFNLGSIFSRQSLVFFAVIILSTEGYPCSKKLEEISRSFSKTIYAPSILQLKKQYFHRTFVSELNNQKFIERVENPNLSHALYFVVENAFLKTLNQSFFKDKELGITVINLFKHIFLKAIEGNSILKPDFIYADYKGIRLIYENDSFEVREALQNSYRLACLEFYGKLKTYPDILKLTEDGNRMVSNPLFWNLAGMAYSKTDDSALLIARHARSKWNEGSLIPIQELEQVKLELNAKVEEAISLQRELIRKIDNISRGKKSKALVYSDEMNGPIFSESFLKMIRSVPHLQGGEKSYLKYIHFFMKNNFGIILEHKTIIKIQRYLHLLDSLSPGIYEPKEVTDLGIGFNKNGNILFDLVGQGAKNFQGTMLALEVTRQNRRTETPLSEQFWETSRTQQKIASEKFEKRRNNILLALNQQGVSFDVKISGDEVVISPHHPISSQQIWNMMKEISSRENPQDYRFVYLAKHTSLHREEVSKVAMEGEEFIKNLKTMVSSNNLMLGVELNPVQGMVMTRVYVYSKSGQISYNEKQKIKEGIEILISRHSPFSHYKMMNGNSLVFEMPSN